MTSITRLIWDMPIKIIIADEGDFTREIDNVFHWFNEIDRIFSPFNPQSEISAINQGRKKWAEASDTLQKVKKLGEQTREQTRGYFEIFRNGHWDLLGLVKGWAVNKAGKELLAGCRNFIIDAGGDIQTRGKNNQGQKWRIGIRNPFNRQENIKIVQLSGQGIATSGTAIRGQHITNPWHPEEKLTEVVSVSVVADNVFNADRLATAAFAMGKRGVEFLASLPGIEAYQVEADGQSIMTPGFNSLCL